MPKSRFGSVEDDGFIINDVSLTVPPTQIRVEKQSFAFNLQTMRTVGSQTIKSGHSTIRVTLDLVIKDMAALASLVAGLRATPFAVVYNNYLQDQLQSAAPDWARASKYQLYQPIVLALHSATFSTMGHVGYVDCVQAQLDFTYFNYFPYTPVYVFKGGEDMKSPTSASDSIIWRAFYSPFVPTELPSFPHIDSRKMPTYFRFLEFKMLPQGTQAGLMAAKDLVDTLKRKPNEFKSALLETYEKARQPAIGQTSVQDTVYGINESNIYDALYRRLSSAGQLRSQLTPQQIAQMPEGSITMAGSPVLDSLLQKTVGAQMKAGATFVRPNNSDLDNAASELTRRIKLAGEKGTESVDPEHWSYFAGTKMAPQSGTDPSALKGMKLFSRSRQLTVSADTDLVVDQITVSIQNILASIPMAGYTYPTCQHLGSTDTIVVFTMNGSNAAAGRLHRMYDIVERTDRQFKQIPQGIRNLTVDNDFLKIFGVKEFFISGLSTGTIPEQPGRSSVVLELQSSGVTSKSSFDGPEEIYQEYIASSEGARREVWGVLSKYLRRVTVSDMYKVKGTDGWKTEIYNVLNDDRNRAFFQLLEKARNLYNGCLANVHGYFFYWGASQTPDRKLYTRFFSGGDWRVRHESMLKKFLGLTDGQVGFTPELGRLKDALRDAYKLVVPGPGNSAKPTPLDTADPAARIATKVFGVTTSAEKTAEENTIELQNALQEMKFLEYQREITRLLDSIIDSYLYLDQFSSLTDLHKRENLKRGRMAYPDFAPQLASVASLSLGATNKQNLDQVLVDYDPDCYLWYPSQQAGLDENGIPLLVDASLISIAKERSIESFRSAQGSVNDFFQRKYLSMMELSRGAPRDRNKAYIPYDKLIDNLHASGHDKALAPSLYENAKIMNATRGLNENGKPDTICHELAPDPSKLYTNWPDKFSEQLLSYNDMCLTHAPNLYDLWGGVGSSIGSPTSSQSTLNRSSAPHIEALTSSPSSELGVEAKSFNFGPNSSQTPNNYGYVCPVAYFREKYAPLGIRDLGNNISGTSSFFGIRSAAAGPDWKAATERFRRNGYTDPAEVVKVLGPVKTWTLEGYKKWASDTGCKVGYLHKGIDIASPVGTSVYAIGDGIVTACVRKPILGAGIHLAIRHNDGRTSRYLHLQDIHPDVRQGQQVKRGQCIAVSGRSGQKKMGPHLHFELWSNYKTHLDPSNKVLDPNDFIPWNSGSSDPAKRYSLPAGSSAAKRVEELDTRKIPTDITSTISCPMLEAIHEYEREGLNGQGESLLRAYPTFKLYFIEDDSEERRRLAFDDFFSYSAVKSIRVVRSREIPADLCVIELTNISGVLTNRKFRQEEFKPGRGDQLYKDTQASPHTREGNVSEESLRPTDANTKSENPIASLMLQEGTQIHLRMGYSNDPDRLGRVFSGRIVNVQLSESDDLIEITAQSFATELVQDIKGLDEPNEKESKWWSVWGLKENASTGRILEEMLAQPEVLHFGRWDPKANGTANRDLLTNKWQFSPNPADDNIFAPDPATERGILGNGLIFKNLKYLIYKTTIWDIIKEMELRHPNFIGAPVPYQDKYGERMTLFFGMPNQLYFSRYPTAEEQRAQDKLVAVQAEASKQNALREYQNMSSFKKALIATFGFGLSMSPMAVDALKSIKAGLSLYESRNARLREARKAGFIRPFRKYHLITSAKHIVQNNIQTNSRDVANTIVVRYPKKVEALAGGVISKTISVSEEASFTLKLDNALPTDDMRTQWGQFVNVTNENLAVRYAVGLLCRNMKQAYKGELIIIGNENISPYDVCFIMDEAADMVGPIEVRKVVQVMDQQSGFLTEITPDMMVAASDWSLLTSAQAMGIVAAGVIGKLGGNQQGIAMLGKTALSVLGSVASGIVGEFLTQSIINYTQLGQPIIMSPLSHHGRPFAGGLPLKRLPHSLWRTIFGKWYNESDSAFSDWMEDVYTDIKNSVKKGLGMHSTGNLIAGFSSNTLEVD